MIGFKELLPVSLVLFLYGCASGVDAVDRSGARDANRASLKVTQTYLVKPDTLALQIDAGKVVYGKQVPYQSQLGDQVKQVRPLAVDWVSRGGKTIGAMVGKERNLLYTFDQVVGPSLDTQWADRQTSYQITSREDTNYSSSTNPQNVFRKSKPNNMARVEQSKHEFPLTHVLYLKLPTALQAGKTYQVSFPGGNVENLSFKYEPNVTRSGAVQVSHVGFSPNDPAKVAFLSTWMGNGGKLDYAAGLDFSVIDEKTNQKVFTGKTQLSKTSQEPEDPRGRKYTLTDVYLMDFSSLQTPGRYRVCVDQIGCSFSFEIGQDVWRQAFYVSARGLYHQRSGIELGPPYTTFKRPRSFHPKDGVVVYDSTAPISSLDQGIGKADFMKVMGKSKTNRQLQNAWGGYFDAGDWDRRIQHVEVARLLFELVELFPGYFDQVNLNVPESKNALPDIVDEALWSLDFFRRLQNPDGGVRGGIQSEFDPKTGEGSWQESLTVLAYAPDMWSSYLYAGGAARAAHWLKSKDPKLAQVYQESALRAIAYAERELAKSPSVAWQIRDARNLAAVELLRLTGDSKWHQIFLQNTVLKDPQQPVYAWDKHNQRDAAFLYARLPKNLVDATIQRNATHAIVREADAAAALSGQTAFKWTKDHPDEPVGWGAGLGTPKAISILRAHHLTGNDQYLKASILATQFSLGANPDNMTYTTGLGHRSPQNPLVIDQRVTGQAPPPGITVYGPYDPEFFGDFWTIGLFKDVMFPAPAAWPTVESYVDIYLFPMATEFTIMQSIAPSAYIWGYLAARNAPNARNAN